MLEAKLLVCFDAIILVAFLESKRGSLISVSLVPGWTPLEYCENVSLLETELLVDFMASSAGVEP